MFSFIIIVIIIIVIIIIIIIIIDIYMFDSRVRSLLVKNSFQFLFLMTYLVMVRLLQTTL